MGLGLGRSRRKGELENFADVVERRGGADVAA
jgi:hypothetical protein